MIKILVKKIVKDATNFYLDILKDASLQAGFDCIFIDNIKDIQNGDIVITTDVRYTFQVLATLKKVKIITWYQGLMPEEAYVMGKGLAKKVVGNIFEYISLRVSVLNIFVSNSMLKHYVQKHCYKKENYFIMPCFNTELCPKLFDNTERYNNATFAYAGGLFKWQCFEKILKTYKYVEEKIDKSFLKIYSPDQELANKLVRKYEIKNYCVCYASPDKLDEELGSAKYGFLIREKSPINYVSTPGKMSNYIASGTIPIFTDAIGDFVEIFNEVDNKIMVSANLNELKIAQRIIEFENKKINGDEVFKEYNYIFQSYYNRTNYIEKLKVKLKDLI